MKHARPMTVRRLGPAHGVDEAPPAFGVYYQDTGELQGTYQQLRDAMRAASHLAGWDCGRKPSEEDVT